MFSRRHVKVGEPLLRNRDAARKQKPGARGDALLIAGRDRSTSMIDAEAALC